MTRLMGLCLLAVAGMLLACGGVGPDFEERVIGTVVTNASELTVDIPDSVIEGNSFTVSVLTYGGGCERAGGTDVLTSTVGVTVTPYDIRYSQPGVTCLDVGRVFRHEATILPPREDSMIVFIRGYNRLADSVETYPFTIRVR